MRRKFFNDYVFTHNPFLFDKFEPCIKTRKPVQFDTHALPLFRLTELQHSAELAGSDAVIQHLPYAVERESEVFQRENPVKGRELSGGVISITIDGVDVNRVQKSGLVVKP